MFGLSCLTSFGGAQAGLRRELADSKAAIAERTELLNIFADCSDPQRAWLLLIPCWWSAALAAIAARAPWPNPWHLALFLIGAFVMRGAGCTWNDIVDRDLDARVERTRSRPIPSGQVSIGQAALFLVLQALVGLAVSAITAGAMTRGIGLVFVEHFENGAGHGIS